MPNPITNFKDSSGTDLGNKLITKEYLMSVYPNIAQEIGKTPELWTWGAGGNGQLGNAVTTDISTPITTFSGGSNWKQVSCGLSNMAAIKTDGTLWCWGRNDNGQLGKGPTTSNVSTPVTTFAGGTNWKQVSFRNFNSAAIKTDGTLWTWGAGANGRLGNASTNIASTPVTTFAGGTNWKQVSVGQFHTAAIKTDGTLWVWGVNNNGRLGNGATTGTVSTPVTTFSGGTNWKQATVGDTHTTAIKTDGTLWLWGGAANGQLGNAVTTDISTPITTFAGGTNWKQVVCGVDITAAIKIDGTLWTWGFGNSGRLGNGATAGAISTPVTTFAGGTNWKQVSTATFNAAAIKTDGTLWGWGRNTNGRLGNASTDTVSTPVTTFAGGTNWKQVSMGYSNIAAIKSADFI